MIIDYNKQMSYRFGFKKIKKVRKRKIWDML